MEGVDFFELYDPVVQCTNVHSMLILEVLLFAFLNSNVEEDDNIFVKMRSRGFERKESC